MTAVPPAVTEEVGGGTGVAHAAAMPMPANVRPRVRGEGRLRMTEPPGSVTFGEYVERRRRPRVFVSRSVKLYDPTSGRYFAGHTCDVSESGLRVELPAKLPAVVGNTACIYVADNHGPGRSRGFIEQTMMVPVRYVWVRRDGATGIATCGVEILSDSASLREAA